MEHIGYKSTGHVLLRYKDNNEVVFDGYNAVHPLNMARAIAKGLANESGYQVYKVKLGNGGTFVNSIDEIEFYDPNITGTSADLYNTTYEEIVDDADVSVGSGNSVLTQEVDLEDLPTSWQVVITCNISASEPVGQDIDDIGNPTLDPESQFSFDELGLFTSDNKLLTHIIFAPILKTANRELELTYTLTITVV